MPITIIDGVVGLPDEVPTPAEIGAVGLTGNQTIAGIKTFSSIPVLPATTPTTPTQATNKAYVDSKTTNWSVNGTNGWIPANPSAQDVGSALAPVHHFVGESFVPVPAIIASNGTFTDLDPDYIYMNAGSGNLTAAIDAANVTIGKRFLFKKTDATANTITVSYTGGNIDGGANVVLSAQYAWVEVHVVSATQCYIISTN